VALALSPAIHELQSCHSDPAVAGEESVFLIANFSIGSKEGIALRLFNRLSAIINR
jgi:hypothetical protein